MCPLGHCHESNGLAQTIAIATPVKKDSFVGNFNCVCGGDGAIQERRDVAVGWKQKSPAGGRDDFLTGISSSLASTVDSS